MKYIFSEPFKMALHFGQYVTTSYTHFTNSNAKLWVFPGFLLGAPPKQRRAPLIL